MGEKFDKAVVKKVIDELNETKNDMVNKLETTLDAMSNVRSVNGIMKLKKQFMIDVLAGMPLDVGSCYFCVYGAFPRGGCGDCTYGKTHGVCGNDDAAYTKIENASEELRDLIIATYW